MLPNQTRFDQAIARFDAANAQDPNIEQIDGRDIPKELLYAQRMTAWLQTIDPDAPESVRLAARCQHIRRWTIPRADFPAGRDGYLRWRAELARFHAKTAAKILREVGYDDAMIAVVEGLLRKRQLKSDPDVQLLEDVICLVFLENYFADFSTQFDEAKVIDIVGKTWDTPQRWNWSFRLPLPSWWRKPWPNRTADDFTARTKFSRRWTQIHADEEHFSLHISASICG